MNTLTKFLIVMVLLALVLFVSFRHNRIVAFDYNENTDLNSREYSKVNQNEQSNETNQVNSQTLSTESTGATLSNSSNIVAETNTIHTTPMDFTEKTLQNTTKPLASETTTLQGTQLTPTSTKISSSSSNTVVNTTVDVEANLPESSETIYSEILTFEKAVRKYISKGYRISTLNTSSVKNAGLIDDQLAQKYDVTFKLAKDGYDIVITLKYPVSEEIRKELVYKKGITLNGEKVVYTFWIKAYR